MDRFPFREFDMTAITTNGSGTGSTTFSDLPRGALWAIDVDYGAADATTVLTGVVVGGAADGTDRTIFVTAASQTDGMRYPRAAATKAADGSAGTGEEVIPLTGRPLKITATVAGASKTISIRVYVLQ
ncbi:MAG: hypothetical protein U0521_26375 [Anaerolineae bacterium]